MGLARVLLDLTPFSQPKIDFNDWAYLANFIPPASVQNSFKAAVPDGRFHKIEEGWGNINLDYYPVRVDELPLDSSAVRYSPDGLLSGIRRSNFQNFIDPNFAKFYKYDDANDNIWQSSNPLNAILRINMRMRNTHLDSIDDNGDVITSEYAHDHWIFSTVYTPIDLGHPVSGNRQFGYVDNNDGTFTFYTRGADRLTSYIDYAGYMLVFPMASYLWESLQAGIANFVNGNKGKATVQDYISTRQPLRKVKPNPDPPGAWL